MKEFYRGKYNFAKVAKEFQLIEQETKTIFICKEPEAKEILDEMIEANKEYWLELK